MMNVSACPSGMACRPGSRFRDAFLGTVAAGALSLAFGGPALAGPDACTISGGGAIETCSGNQSVGIAIPPATVTTLNVNNLTQAITPASGTPGIVFLSLGAITITSNTGAFGITTTGMLAFGIAAESIGGGAVTVTSTGNITTAGANAFGIVAIGTGAAAVTVTSTGNISTAGAFANGIEAQGNGAGAVTVTSTGNISTAGIFANGIEAQGAGAATVTSSGNITTTGRYASGIAASASWRLLDGDLDWQHHHRRQIRVRDLC